VAGSVFGPSHDEIGSLTSCPMDSGSGSDLYGQPPEIAIRNGGDTFEDKEKLGTKSTLNFELARQEVKDFDYEKRGYPTI